MCAYITCVCIVSIYPCVCVFAPIRCINIVYICIYGTLERLPNQKQMAISFGTFKLTNRAGPNIYNSTFDGFMTLWYISAGACVPSVFLIRFRFGDWICPLLLECHVHPAVLEKLRLCAFFFQKRDGDCGFVSKHSSAPICPINFERHAQST